MDDDTATINLRAWTLYRRL